MLALTGAKDPDEYIKTRGPDAFRNLLEGSENQLDYRLRSVVEKYDLGQDAQKVDFLKEATDLVARLPSAPEREVYAMRVATLAGIPADAVVGEVRQRRKRLLSKANRDTERQQTRPGRASAPAGRPHYDDEASARAEEGIIRVLLLDPALARDPTLPPPEAFTAPPLSHIYRSVLDRLRQGGEVTTATLGAALSSEEMSLLVRLQDEPLAAANSERALKDYIQKLYECKESKQAPGSPEDLLTLQRKLRERKGYEDA